MKKRLTAVKKLSIEEKGKVENHAVIEQTLEQWIKEVDDLHMKLKSDQ